MEHNHAGFMETEELDKLKFQTLKEIADSNLLVAKMKAELADLEKDKETFFLKRENEVLGRIHKLLNGSRTILEETETNYKKVHQFYEVLREYSDYLSKSHDTFFEIVNDFNKKGEVWKKDIDKQTEEISEQKKSLKLQEESIEKEKKFIKDRMVELKKEEKHIESKQRQIKNALEYLKTKQ